MKNEITQETNIDPNTNTYEDVSKNNLFLK
mgnify:CR=1 FL=1